MNRKQQIVLFLLIAALVVTWLFPYWIHRYRDRSHEGIAFASASPYSSGYSFIFTQTETGLRIDWGRLILTDLMIVAVGVSLVYVLRSQQ